MATPELPLPARFGAALCALVALVCLAWGPPQDAPPLLPPTPADWRYERLDFPLSFAPDIALEGFEELRFAPGMFDPDSDTWFSYVLGIRTEEPVDVDAEFLRSFLLEYYRGLCGAVGESRGLALDLSRVAADVQPAGADFHATIAMYDAFVTGEPMTLRLEVLVHQRAAATELFAMASPLEESAPVWATLRALGDAWRVGRSTPVFLNHLYVIPDAATWDALASSELLRDELGIFEQRTTVRTDVTYTGLYFYGDHTYFEFLRPDADSGFSAGGTGVAFGMEDVGATARLSAALRDQGIESFARPVTRATADGEQVPWFDMLGIQRASTTSQLNLFSLEYDVRFLGSWNAGHAPAGGSLSRADVLERYAAVLGRHDVRHDALFADVVEIRLALDAAEREHVLAVCRAFGYATSQDGDVWTCTGPDARLTLTASDEPGGIVGFVVTLREAVPSRTLDFGQVTLTLEGRSGTFTFRG